MNDSEFSAAIASIAADITANDVPAAEPADIRDSGRRHRRDETRIEFEDEAVRRLRRGDDIDPADGATLHGFGDEDAIFGRGI